MARTAPYWAPTTPPTSSSAASTMSTAWVVSGVDHGRHRADRQDHDQAGADHDARRHAKQVDHRRNQDEAAADAEQHGHHRRRRSRAQAAPAATGKGRKHRSASAAAGSATQRLWRGRSFGSLELDPAQRDQRILQHQAADPAEQEDVEEADDEIDLAADSAAAGTGRRRPGCRPLRRRSSPAPIFRSTPPRRIWA